MTMKNGFQILDQHVTKLHFDLDDQYDQKKKGQRISLEPQMDIRYDKVPEEKKIIVNLSIKISGKNVPFKIDVILAGLFQLVGDEMADEALDKMVHINCAAALFPFLREVVANTTQRGGFPPLMLPSMNFVDSYYSVLIERRNEEREQGGGEMTDAQIKQFMQILAKEVSANPLDIIKKIKIDFSNKDLDLFVERLFELKMIKKPHPQSRTYSLPDYDCIVISDKGKQMADGLKTE